MLTTIAGSIYIGTDHSCQVDLKNTECKRIISTDGYTDEQETGY